MQASLLQIPTKIQLINMLLKKKVLKKTEEEECLYVYVGRKV